MRRALPNFSATSRNPFSISFFRRLISLRIASIRAASFSRLDFSLQSLLISSLLNLESFKSSIALACTSSISRRLRSASFAAADEAEVLIVWTTSSIMSYALSSPSIIWMRALIFLKSNSNPRR